MTAAGWALDGLLACALPLVAWRALATGDLPKAVVLFIAFGLLSAVAWARLDAPDIAMVEAAVGTGLTGALLVSSLRWMAPERRGAPPRSRGRRIALGALVLGPALAIEAAILGLPGDDPGLGDLVRAHVPETGVEHPVTAVLLDFRAYDTLLEVAVLVVAAIAIRPPRRSASLRPDEPVGSPFAVLVRMIVPGVVLVAGYLLWRGSTAPAGAFQAAAVLAGGGILAIVAGTLRLPPRSSAPMRAGLVLGPGLFLAIAAAPLLAAGGHLLEYPDSAKGELILAIEAGLALSIALVLATFFPGATDRASPIRPEAHP